MTQAPEKGEEPCLPHGLCVASTYTEMTIGSKCVAIVIKNQMAALITIGKDIKITQVVAVNRAPPVEVNPGALEKLDEIQGIQWTQMTIEWRKEMLLQQLDLSGLEGWSGANHMSAHALLIENHDVFSLEHGELGCRSLTKPVIWVVNDEPFKERFQRIPPLIVKEVRAHMKEMLEAGSICPSQSPWCNVAMLVRKKDGGLHFSTDLCKLNVKTKKDSYPLPHIQEALESLVGAGYFSCLDLKAGFWQITMDEALKQYTAFTVGNLGFFKCEHMPFGLCNAPVTFQRLTQNYLGKLNLMYCLIYLDDMIVVCAKTEKEHL